MSLQNSLRELTKKEKKKLTKSSDVPNLSNSKDWIREIWTPISLCIPEHSMQVKMPKLVDSHVGSVELKNKIFSGYLVEVQERVFYGGKKSKCNLK